MSQITEMVIYASLGEHAAMERLNAWCAERDPDRKQQFRELDPHQAGGAKFFTSSVWAMAGNYFPAEDLLEVFPSFGWNDPEGVLMIVEGEQDVIPRIQRASDSNAVGSGDG